MDGHMMRVLFFILTLLCAPAFATDRYVCDCNTTSTTQPHASCSAGSSGGTGTSSSSPKQFVSQLSDPSTWAAGDRLFYCQGGVHKEWVWIERNNNATRANPIVIDSYAPPSGATGKPVLTRTVAVGAAVFDIGQDTSTNLGSADIDGDGVGDGHGGYIIQNLKFECDGTANGWGLRIRSPTHSVQILNNDFTACGIGIRSEQYQSGGGAGVVGKNKFLIVKDNTFTNNPGLAGFNGGCSECDIEDNTFTGNGAGSSTTHAIYAGCGSVGGSTSPCVNMRIRRNTLTDNSIDGAGQCIGGNLTTRGQQTGTVVEGNIIKITAGTRNGSCVGISHAEGYNGEECMVGSKIRHNILIGTLGISVGSVQNGVIENNIVIDVSTQSIPAALLSVGGPNYESGIDCGMLNMVVRHNTAYSAQPYTSTKGILVGTTGGTGNIICNNLIKFGSNPNSAYYVNLNTSGVTYTEVCNNLGHGGSGWMSTAATTAAFEAVSAYNASGQRTGDPVLVGTPSVASPLNACIQTTSDAKNNAKLTPAARTSRLAINGYVRDATADIGACEYGRNP